MEALDCISHRSTPVPQAAHSSHNRGPAASLETDASYIEPRSAGHGSGYDCLPAHLRSGTLAGSDLWFDHFTGYMRGTCQKHKNDRVRRGHHPALRIRSWTLCISCVFGWRRWT